MRDRRLDRSQRSTALDFTPVRELTRWPAHPLTRGQELHQRPLTTKERDCFPRRRARSPPERRCFASCGSPPFHFFPEVLPMLKRLLIGASLLLGSAFQTSFAIDSDIQLVATTVEDAQITFQVANPNTTAD